MKILGIESSCDDTCSAVVEDGTRILSNVVASQIDIFAGYGGVIPEVAARSHLEAILPCIEQALRNAHTTWDDIDCIAVTHTPGLMGSLLIGTLTARTLAILHDKPLYPVHHLKSHIYANWLREERVGELAFSNVSLANILSEPHFDNVSQEKSSERSEIKNFSPDEHVVKMLGRDTKRLRGKSLKNAASPQFPLLSLIISGGHTQIIYMPAHNQFEIIGTTLDDAVGECFDKIAKILGLPYPGGPSISKLALQGDREKYHFPHPKTENPLDFSFSGLKTAVLRAVQSECGVPLSYPSHGLSSLLSEAQKADFAASFERTAIDILLEKLEKALETHPDVKSICFAGGVSANEYLREKAPKNSFFPAKSLSGDNAAMVASACYYEIISGVQPSDPYAINIAPRTSIETPKL